ncbi:MAG: hypothetical protein HKN50_01595 [Gammaproteobacteria bacterium]|nr:hypothetical protein [Gammaproteobacteria bacterium]
MFKQIFRLTFVTLVWKQYKGAIVSTLLLFAYMYIVNALHEDYLAYANLEQQATIGQSFAIKWAALLAGVLIYLVYNFFLRRPRNKAPRIASKGDQTDEANDPFAEIRRRKTLRSRADMIVDPTDDNGK